MVMVAHGVADNLSHSIVAPPAPILMGAAAVCAGAAVVKHLRKGKNQGQTKDLSESKVSPTSRLLFSNCVLVPAGVIIVL